MSLTEDRDTSDHWVVITVGVEQNIAWNFTEGHGAQCRRSPRRPTHLTGLRYIILQQTHACQWSDRLRSACRQRGSTAPKNDVAGSVPPKSSSIIHATQFGRQKACLRTGILLYLPTQHPRTIASVAAYCSAGLPCVEAGSLKKCKIRH